MKEAQFYIARDGKVKCLLCPHTCVLSDGQRGKCHVRKSVGGKLISESYGRVSALHIDPIEKKPLYHFLPGTKSFSISTNGCVLTCLNCQNWQISQRGMDEGQNEFLPPEMIVRMAVDANCKSISYTYTDPVVYYEYMLDIAQLAKSSGLKNVMVSSGYINPMPLKRLIPFIDAANIDLKCFDDRIYQNLNGAKLKPVLQSLISIKESGVWLEITNLIIPEWTDDLVMIGEMCKWLVKEGFQDTPLHFNRFVPTYKLNSLDITPLTTLLEAKKMATDQGIKFVYVGNVYGPDYTTTFCPGCGNQIVDRFNDLRLNGLNADGECKRCKELIPGIWS